MDRRLIDDTRAWAIDLDGVVWRGADSIPGAADAVAELRARGDAIAFVTNSSIRTRGQVAANLERHGVPDAADQVITSGMAAATLCSPGERAFVCGGDGVHEELARRGVDIVAGGPVDVVVVGIWPSFDYEVLTTAMRAVRAGARLIATNDDATFPVDGGGFLPGNGALVAAVERASGRSAVVAGKPHPPMAELVIDMLGPHGVMVGDRPETDGEFAAAVGYDFALVLSGVIGPDDLPVSPTPAVVAADLGSLIGR